MSTSRRDSRPLLELYAEMVPNCNHEPEHWAKMGLSESSRATLCVLVAVAKLGGQRLAARDIESERSLYEDDPAEGCPNALLAQVQERIAKGADRDQMPPASQEAVREAVAFVAMADACAPQHPDDPPSSEATAAAPIPCMLEVLSPGPCNNLLRTVRQACMSGPPPSELVANELLLLQGSRQQQQQLAQPGGVTSAALVALAAPAAPAALQVQLRQHTPQFALAALLVATGALDEAPVELREARMLVLMRPALAL